MIEIDKTEQFIQLTYSYGEPSYRPEDWIINELKSSGYVGIKHRIFTLTPDLIASQSRFAISTQEFINNFPDITFNIGSLTKLSKGKVEDEYYRIYPNVLVRNREIYLHKDIDCDIDIFVAETNISIFKQIAELMEGDIIIGGKLPNSVPLEEYYGLIQDFPTTYEKKLYAQSRISSILRNYFDNVKDSEKLFRKYRNNKPSVKGVELLKLFDDYEVNKFQTIYEKLASMLDDEENYSETQWQIEIIDILLLLYPKYIAVFKEVPVNADDIKEKSLDFL